MKLFYEKQENKHRLMLSQFDKEHGQFQSYLHWHKMIEFCYMVEGRCDFLIGGRNYVAEAGDIIVFASGEIHQYNNRLGHNKKIICMFDPILLYNLCGDVGVIPPHIRLSQLQQAGIEGNIQECFQTLVQEKKHDQTGSSLLYGSSLLRLYGLLLRHFGSSEKASDTELSRKLSFQQILEYVSENYTERITLDTLAEHFSYSSGYISELFRVCAGVNFKQYLDNTRVTEAVRLLQSTQMSIGDVSAACGFENIRTFNNVFKRITGASPSELKKRGY